MEMTLTLYSESKPVLLMSSEITDQRLTERAFCLVIKVRLVIEVCKVTCCQVRMLGCSTLVCTSATMPLSRVLSSQLSNWV